MILKYYCYPPPLSEKYYNQIYEPLYRIIKNKEKELLNLKDKLFDFYQVKKILGNIDTLNSLPNYFDKIRTDIAYATRNLSVEAYNNKNNLDLSMKLIDLALQINVSEKAKKEFENDKKTLQEIEEENKLMQKLEKVQDILTFDTTIKQKVIDIIDFINSLEFSRRSKVVIPIYNMFYKYNAPKCQDNNLEKLVIIY